MFESLIGKNLITFSIIGVSAVFVLIFFILWSIVWKGFALWISSRENKKWWFISLLVINTAGILEILFIFLFSDWGQSFRDKFLKNKKKITNSDSKECDCTSCDGCDCECHKPLTNN